MSKTLKEWAELLNNVQYENIDEVVRKYREEMEQDNVVVVYGSSDDLLEMNGAYYDEMSCYNNQKILFVDNSFISQYQYDDILSYVQDNCPTIYDYMKKCLKYEYYIDVKHPKSVQFEYETNIPCEWFNVNEDEKLYCKGFIFNVQSLKK